MSDDTNPYAAPLGDVERSSPSTSFIYRRSMIVAGVFAWVGMTIGGGLVGGVRAGSLGLRVCLEVFSITGLPISLAGFAMVALFSPSLVRKRKVIFVGATCGGLAGILGHAWLISMPMAHYDIAPLFFASGSCAIGAAVFVFLRLRPMS